MLNRYFCVEHNEKWLTSPEHARAAAVGIAAHTLSMMSDFERRMRAEEAANGD